ncbi:glutathione-dependent formaldehyde-activating GFA [Pseudomonas putida GB-1]|uniref:Glutathione-dependent formaldehyde-activating GFA n=2 Tax=Pseudomonas TaxID=286 RepID=B0KIA3_PSEPG|nr:glutathione-dependent formaldehyde-activating GFA [Pseudomonas putida GB-1]
MDVSYGQSTDQAWAFRLAFSSCTEAPMTEVYQGSCLCTAVSYLLLTPPKAVSHCHCSQCRKGHGAAFASYGSVPRNMLRILRGATYIKTFASSPTVVREFCVACGSSLFWSRSQGDFADWVSIALGTLDTPFLPKKQKHVHIDSAAPWYSPCSLA